MSEWLGESIEAGGYWAFHQETPRTGGLQIISDRIFIDQLLLDEIRKALPSSSPVITYLGNNFKVRDKETPYSFISALPAELYPDIPQGQKIIINRWLADDLSAREGDSVMYPGIHLIR